MIQAQLGDVLIRTLPINKNMPQVIVHQTKWRCFHPKCFIINKHILPPFQKRKAYNLVP